MKEQNNCFSTKANSITKDISTSTEISNNESQKTIVKMINEIKEELQNLSDLKEDMINNYMRLNRIKKQMNGIKKTVQDMKEEINKDMETLKNNQSEINNSVSQIKNLN
jgi:uncharacterized coiled-coil DUF342 family protein